MKKYYCIACLLVTMVFLALTAGAQVQKDTVKVEEVTVEEIEHDEVPPPPPSRLFAGGSFSAGFYNGGSSWGINPMLGYQFNRYVDGGVVLNLLWAGRRDYMYTGDKYRYITYGGGVFTRVYPVDFLFAQAQLEYNGRTEKYKTSFEQPYIKSTVSAPSLLLGGGYRSGGYDSPVFFYMSVMVDVLKNRNSPYVDVSYENGNEKVRMLPVINAGVNFNLFRNRYRDPREYEAY